VKRLLATLILCAFLWQITNAQSASINRKEFFAENSIADVTITSNVGKLFKNNKQGVTFPATISMKADGKEFADDVQLEIRGHFRHDFCYVPPLKLNFNRDKPTPLASLKSLKLVNECKVSAVYDQYVFKEFLCYKIYNLLTDMSFRVRLLNVTFADSAGKKKPLTIHSFLLEDIKDVAKRNDCEQYRKSNLVTEATNRKQTTMVSIFEYLIGNTDWAIPVNHNTKLIYSVKDTSIRPYVVPYDFDYSGFVNTDYAIPSEKLDIENVRDRLYRGFPRTMAEINEALYVFKSKKNDIYALVKNFELLTPRTRDEINSYLDDFYKMINNPKDVKSIFIDNARTQ
jgi:hypothetical protein